MKTSTIFALLALLVCSPAFAGLSVVTGSYEQGSSALSCAISGTVESGQVVILMEEGTASTSLIVSDNVSSGDYSVLSAYAGANNMAIFWKVTNAAGTPTISISGTTGYTYAWCFAISGFTGTPTSDTAIQSTATATSTTEQIDATSNFANEAMLINEYNAGGLQSISPGGWSEGSGTPYGAFYSIEASAGTTNNFSATLNPSEQWWLQLAGIYDATSEGCTHDGYTAGGAIAVPNGTSGSYLLKNGSYGIPSCASSGSSYWAPKIGNFVTQ